MRIAHRKLLFVLLPLVLVALLAEIHMARRQLRAERILRQVESMTMTAVGSGRMPRTLTASNLRLLREAEELAPFEVSIPIARGSQFLLMNRPEEALSAYSAALELEARPEIYLNLGRAHRLNGDDESALQAFAQAVRLSPRLRSEVPADIRKKVNSLVRRKS